jgi:mono/diheme cytochrome c family protein
MKQLWIGTAVLAAALFGVPVLGYAQGADIGKQEYVDTCAACHGTNAKGTGPVAAYLKQKTPDLTMLAKNSAGVFPFARVYDVIDGRQAVAVHGPRDMPVWGKYYRDEAISSSGGNATAQEISSSARGRIIALIGFIYTLQAK